MTLPLRITVTTAFAIFTAIIISVVATLNYFGNRDTIMHSARTNISSAAEEAEQGVDRLLTRAILTADTVSRLPIAVFDWQNPETLLAILAVSLRSSPEVYGVFVGFPDGAFTQAVNLIAPDGSRRKVTGMPESAATAWRVIEPSFGGQGGIEKWWYFDRSGKEIGGQPTVSTERSTYDPRTRGWFKESQRDQTSIVSNVYVFSSLQKPGVTVSKPVENLKTLSVGVDLSLDDLASLTARLSPGRRGVVAIIDGDGMVVAHPDPDKVVTATTANDEVELVPASDIDDVRVRFGVREHASRRSEGASFSADGEDYITYYRAASKERVAQWDVISVAAVADYTGDLITTMQRSMAIAAVVLAFAVGGVAVMAGWITRPVIRLRRLAEQITQLNFSEAAEHNSPFEEINRLQKSMTQMKGALDTFLRFVPRDVVRELVLAGQAATVGGHKKEVTLLFTDVEGFTTMTERMTPEEIMSQVSEYLENLSFGIQANRGTIDKYIGDAIMAIWNAPTDDHMHADNACRGALSAYHISEDLNAQFLENGQSVMRTRFGLHTGDVLVGNIGARDRMQYTCLGSNVNLAARIEGLNKFYGTQVLASDAVRRRASPDFLFRRVDIVEAKGTTLPVTIYELMGERGEDAVFYVGPEVIKRASKYEQAFDFYLHRDFGDALVVLEKLTVEQPDDPVVALLVRKCRVFLDTPPPPTWNGATVLDEK